MWIGGRVRIEYLAHWQYLSHINYSLLSFINLKGIFCFPGLRRRERQTKECVGTVEEDTGKAPGPVEREMILPLSPVFSCEKQRHPKK